MEFPEKETGKRLGLRLDSALHDKLHYISQYDGRSANGAVIYLIWQRIGSLSGRTEKSICRNNKKVRRGFPSACFLCIIGGR